jgi:signal transduction histidine kinase
MTPRSADTHNAEATSGREQGRSRAAALSLEYKLPLLLAALLGLSSVLLLGVTYRVITRTSEGAAEERLANAAREVAASAAGVVEARLSDLARIAVSPAVQEALRADPSELPSEALLELLSEPAEGSSATVELRRSDGSLVARVGPPPADARWLEDPPRSPVASTPLHASGLAAFAWTIVPVVASDVPIGWLAREWRLGGPPGAERSLTELTGEAVTMHIRNADGSVWARQSGVPEAAPTRSGTVRTGGLTYDWPGLGRVLAAEGGMLGTPMVVTLQTPLRLVHARARATVGSLAVASLLILLLGVGAAWVLGRGLARPLASLAVAAEAIAAGDYDRRVAVAGADELGRLGATFNQMAGEIQTARAELMRRFEQAQQSRRESDGLREAAEEARELAEHANRAKSDFLAVMSHELRTPLNAIAGYTELLEMGLRGPLNESQREALRRIERNQAHLLSLIDDVLRYAQLEAGKVEFDLSTVPVETVLGELETFLAPQMGAAGLRLERQTLETPLHVVADPDKLHQILLNLLTNAIKFTPEGGAVSVSADAVPGGVGITVRDTGIGIPADRQQAIFDPFFQGHRRTDRPSPGVGLGLTISRDLARGMAGDLTVSSVAGEGSAFTLVLPAAPSVRPPGPASGSHAPSAAPPGALERELAPRPGLPQREQALQ